MELFFQPAVPFCIPPCHRPRNTSGMAPEMLRLLLNFSKYCLQSFDSVGWAAGRASGL